jgi:hypothetical protein
MVAVTDDPHRVLTQLLSCLLEEPSPRALESKFAIGGEGFAVANVIEARPSEGGMDSWTVTMHRAKATPRVVVLGGDELRQLVHAALFPRGSAVGERNRKQATLTFGIAGATFVGATLAVHQVADWFVAVPFGLVMALIVGVRAARFFLG